VKRHLPKKRVGLWLVLMAVLAFPALSHAQGCSLCRDTTAGSAPRARQGLRRAILVLGVPAGAIFLGILVVAKRIKPRENLDSGDQRA
jgi:hypothetical protein